MKKAILVILMAFLLTGCRKHDDRLKIVKEYGYNIWILTDTETGVCYLKTDDSLLVMVDRNGNPYIANGWRDYSDGDDLY